jgi:glutamine---fructose-6-phosphate transaminase (isomerizing)
MDEHGAAPTGFTIEEGIAAQPASLRTSAAIVAEQLEAGLFDVAGAGSRLVLAGIGASHAALAAPLYVLRKRGVSAQRTSCGELPAGGALLGDLYVGVSQSGRSRETIEALLEVPPDARVGVVNAESSPLATICARVLRLGGLKDSGVSTVAFSATLQGLGMAVDRWTLHKATTAWADLGDRVDELLSESPEIAAAAEEMAGVGAFDLVGAGPSATAAEQGALLFRECAHAAATGMETRSYLHGPMDAAGDTAHVLFGAEREALLAQQLAEKKVPILLVTDSDCRVSGARVVRLPRLDACQRAVLETVVAQQLVVAVGRLRGVAMDEDVFKRLDTKVDSVAQAGTAP